MSKINPKFECKILALLAKIEEEESEKARIKYAYCLFEHFFEFSMDLEY